MAPKQTSALLQDIADALGQDVYYIYPDSLHAIPLEIVEGIAAACVAEFVNGFIDFRQLGQATRKELEALLGGWRSSRDLGSLIQTLDLESATSQALAAVPPEVNARQLDEGQAALQQALLKFGMDDALAREHAQVVRELVQRSLATQGGHP